jgi:hypothetical protein
MTELSDPINVWAYFENGVLKPKIFLWNGRQIKIDTINFVHATRNGFSPALHFAVSSGGNFYQLAFDSVELKWFLEAVEEE